MRGSALFLIAACTSLAAGAQAAPVCTTYTTANGTAGFPGTDVGVAGTDAGDVCKIGDLSKFNSGGGVAYVPNSDTPSIYSFFFAGGVLSVTEQTGNNGYPPNGLTVSFDALADISSTAPSSVLATVGIPFSYGPSAVTPLLSNRLLAPGYYAIDTALAGGNNPGPNFEINLAVPEPASLTLLAVPVLLAVRRRRRGTDLPSA